MSNYTPPILTLSNHTINRGDFILCQGIHLELQSGQICHLIGANGTGKTTLLMQLAGLLPLANDVENLEDEKLEVKKHETETLFSDKGTLERVTTRHSYKHKMAIPPRPVYISHQLGIHEDLTVEQNLRFLLDLYSIQPTHQQVNEALTWVALDGYETTACRQLSAGQTRRVNLARLKLMTPEHSPLWLLDEPFTSLDTDMVVRLQQKIRAFADNGGVVIMTSHQNSNMAELIDLTFNLAKFVA